MKTTLKTSGSHITAGTDLMGEHSVLIQEVNGTPCIAVHKCREEGGMHYTLGNDESIELAIPIAPIYKLLTERKSFWEERKC